MYENCPFCAEDRGCRPVLGGPCFHTTIQEVRICRSTPFPSSAPAKEYDIELGMEVLNRFENHILNTAEEGVAFVKEVSMDNVKVMLDTFHMNIEESTLSARIILARPRALCLRTLTTCSRRFRSSSRI